VRSLAIATALLAVGLGSGPADAQAARTVPQSQARQAMRFWTPARMKRARPLDGLRSGAPSIAAGAEQAVASSPHAIPPLAPSGEPAGASSATETVLDPTLPLTRTNGVIFIALGPFALGRCSGTSVNAPNFSVVFTAAHCIRGGGPRGEWFPLRWVFVPGYRYGQRPFGVFPAKWMETTRLWRTTGSENFDVGAVVVSRNERGQRLGKVVGGTGIAWGQKPRQVFDVHGYSAESPFDGETQQLCAQTPFLGHDPRSFLDPGPLNLAVECEVSGGASGGGWTIEGNMLNSVTSYGYGGEPSIDFGPYFGKEVGRLYTGARRVR
jgi:hypothetical protein